MASNSSPASLSLIIHEESCRSGNTPTHPMERTPVMPANLDLSSPELAPGAKFDIRNTGRGEDLSPQFSLTGLSPNAKSLAITLDDLAFPMKGGYNHWVIWNLPVEGTILGGIPAGATLPSGAVQGVGYGKHAYAGPKPPMHLSHQYRFTVYALDTELDIPASSKKKQFLAAAQGHVLQTATLDGVFE